MVLGYEHEILFSVQPKPGTEPGEELRNKVLLLDCKTEECNCRFLVIPKIDLHRFKPTGYLRGFSRPGQISVSINLWKKEAQQ